MMTTPSALTTQLRTKLVVTTAFAFAIALSAPVLAQDAVSALGFVEPEGGVVQVSGAISSDGATVKEMRVDEGQRVDAGDIIAIMDNNGLQEAAVLKAQANIGIAQARLDQIKAGASQNDLSARRARVNRLANELRNAINECNRAETLRTRDVIAQSVRDERCLQPDIIEGQKLEAEAELRALAEVRDVDIKVAEAEVIDAEAAHAQALARLDRTIVRAPTAGRILRTHVQSGEIIGEQGVVDLGKTDYMWILAEVYETDIDRVSLGQSARITSDGFQGTLNGEVATIGLLIAKNNVFETDPTADVDARVVEVNIKLNEEDSAKVSHLTNLQVNVVIDTGPGS